MRREAVCKRFDGGKPLAARLCKRFDGGKPLAARLCKRFDGGKPLAARLCKRFDGGKPLAARLSLFAQRLSPLLETPEPLSEGPFVADGSHHPEREGVAV